MGGSNVKDEGLSRAAFHARRATSQAQRRDAAMPKSHMQECDAEKCLRKMVATKANRTSLAVAIVLAEAALAAAVVTPIGAADALFGGSVAGRIAAMACLSPAAAVWAGAVLLTWYMGREASRACGAMMVVPAKRRTAMTRMARTAATQARRAPARPSAAACLPRDTGSAAALFVSQWLVNV